MSPSPFISIPDNYVKYSLDSFVFPEHFKEAIDHIIIPNGILADRTDKMAQDLLRYYHASGMTGGLTLVCVLKGAVRVFSELSRALDKYNRTDNYVPCFFEFIRCQSYENDASTGVLKITGMDATLMTGKNLVIIEDIIDTGATMKSLVELAKSNDAKTISVVSLVLKRTPKRSVEVSAYFNHFEPSVKEGFPTCFIGFEVPEVFVTGYYFDFNQNFRDIPHVCAISKAGFEKYRC